MQTSSGTTILEKIRRLAEKRQALWSKMSSLTEADRAAIAHLTRELESLWEQHRLELAQHGTNRGRASAKGGVAPSRRRTAA